MYKKRECVDKEICLECKYGKENKFTYKKLKKGKPSGNKASYKKYNMTDLNKSS